MGLFGASSPLDKGLDAFAQRNWRRARKLLEEASIEDPRANGDYHLGLLYWRGLGGKKDQDAAVDCFARAADSGLPSAQTAYAMALRAGIGVQQDAEAARALFRSAAGAGDREAMTQLGLMGDERDARRWLTRAAEEGHAPAMVHLAEHLVNDDPVEALSWLYAAVAIGGDDAARKAAAQLARELTAKEIDQAQKFGRAYLKNFRKAHRR